RDCDRSASQKHRVVGGTRAGGKELSLARERKADFSHSRLMDRAGHDRINFAGICEASRLFKRGKRGTRGFRSRVTGRTIGRVADYKQIGAIDKLLRFERSAKNLRPNARSIADRYANARKHRPLSGMCCVLAAR